MTNETNLMTATADDLAAIAATTYYADLNSAATIDAYLNSYERDEYLTLRDNLSDALNDDIADLLHNANAPELFPTIDDLDPADESRFLLNLTLDLDFFDDFCNALATIIHSRYAHR